MKRFLFSLVAILSLSLSLFANEAAKAPEKAAAKSAITTFKLGVDRETFAKTLREGLEKEGYVYVGMHDNIQSAYKEKIGSTKMDSLDFIIYYNPKLFSTVAEESPQVAGTFYPFTFVVHKSQGDKDTYVSFLDGDFVKVLGNLKQKAVIDAIDAEYVKLNKVVSEIAKSKETKSWVSIPAKMEGNSIFEYKIKVPSQDKAERLLSLVQAQLDDFIIAGKFINAGYRGINGDLKKLKNEKFDLYDEYLLCSLSISHAIFNDYPQVGAFAPCPVFMYKEKGSEYLTIGVMQMDIWSQFGPIKDEKTKEVVTKGAQEVQFVLKYSVELALKKLNDEIAMEGDEDEI